MFVFSALYNNDEKIVIKKIKEWFCTSVYQDRFSNSSVIYIKKDICCRLNNDNILNKFSLSNRRSQL